jgi:hypothetical protein
MTIWYICVHLVQFSGFGIMHQEKSGNPAREKKNWICKIWSAFEVLPDVTSQRIFRAPARTTLLNISIGDHLCRAKKPLS